MNKYLLIISIIISPVILIACVATVNDKKVIAPIFISEPSIEEFDELRDIYELLAQTLLQDDQLVSIEKKTEYLFKRSWHGSEDILSPAEIEEYDLNISTYFGELYNFIKLEDEFYVSRINGKQYPKDYIDKYINFMDELNIYRLNKTIDGGVTLLKSGDLNDLDGLGYYFTPSGAVDYQDRYIKEKINDNWYIISIFN